MLNDYKDLAKTLQDGFASKDFPLPPHEFKRGEIVQVSEKAFEDDEKNSIRFKRRPAIVIQNNSGNQHSANLIVCYLSSQIKKESLPTHVLIDDAGCVSNCMIMAENIQTIKKEFVRPIGFLDKELMDKLENALVVSIGLQQYIRARIDREVEKVVKKTLEGMSKNTYENNVSTTKDVSESNVSVDATTHKGLLQVSGLKGKQVSYHIQDTGLSITSSDAEQHFLLGDKLDTKQFMDELSEVLAYL